MKNEVVEGVPKTLDDKKMGESQELGSLVHINLLPIEVLINIFGNLEMIQLGSIRLVCKTWNFAVSDKSTWIRSFSLRFGSSLKFPSVTNSPLWMQEYFARLKIYKKWKKAQGKHQSYQLINNEYRNIDFSLINFERNQSLGKLLTFSKRYGTITTCNVVDGKNQTFIPSDLYNQMISFNINWNYLLMGLKDGNLILRNLTTSGTNSSSTTKFISGDLNGGSIIATEMNNYSNMDKFKRKVDIIAGTILGKLQFWNIAGNMVHDMDFEEPILKIKSDFNKFIIFNTRNHIYILNFQDYEILQKIQLQFEITIPATFENIYNYYGTRNEAQSNELDVDFGDYNIILCYEDRINSFNFRDLENIHHRELILEDGVSIVKSQLQTTEFRKTRVVGSRDVSLAGKDGLFYGNILNDSSIIVWNIRQNGPIVPQCRIYPSFSKYHPKIPTDNPHIGAITCIALNSSIVAVGGYNGFTNIYNIFTGEFIKEASVKFPRKFSYMYDELIPINEIKLNQDQLQTNGVIICGDTIQYFQFGDKEKPFDVNHNQNSKLRKKLNKINLKYSILDELKDYDQDQYNDEQQQILFNKYNGNQWEDEDEELSMAIAMSKSSLSATESDLQVAIEMSQNEIERNETINYYESEQLDMDEEEQLRRILELSLIDN